MVLSKHLSLSSFLHERYSPHLLLLPSCSRNNGSPNYWMPLHWNLMGQNPSCHHKINLLWHLRRMVLASSLKSSMYGPHHFFVPMESKKSLSFSMSPPSPYFSNNKAFNLIHQWDVAIKMVRSINHSTQWAVIGGAFHWHDGCLINAFSGQIGFDAV